MPKAPHIALAAAILLLLPQQTTYAQQPTHTVHLAVVDGTHAPVGGAHIMLHRDPSLPPSAPDRSLDTDASGKLTLPLTTGVYVLCAMSPAYTPTCRKLTLQDRDLDLVLTLPVSPDIAGPTPAP